LPDSVADPRHLELTIAHGALLVVAPESVDLLANELGFRLHARSAAPDGPIDYDRKHTPETLVDANAHFAARSEVSQFKPSGLGAVIETDSRDLPTLARPVRNEEPSGSAACSMKVFPAVHVGNAFAREESSQSGRDPGALGDSLGQKHERTASGNQEIPRHARRSPLMGRQSLDWQRGEVSGRIDGNEGGLARVRRETFRRELSLQALLADPMTLGSP